MYEQHNIVYEYHKYFSTVLNHNHPATALREMNPRNLIVLSQRKLLSSNSIYSLNLDNCHKMRQRLI